MRSRRALLYVPGDDLHKIRKATTLDVDCVCMDLEDGVAISRKQSARETISNALRTLDFGRSERLVRVNPVASTLVERDLQEILPAQPDGIVIPKVTHADQIRSISEKISIFEDENNLSVDSIILIALIESAQGVVNLGSISSADPRLEALIFGAEDFAADIGAQRSESGWEVFYARSAVVTHCAAHQLQAIDMVNINFHDLTSLHARSTQGARMGYVGKQVIHPDQVQIVQQAFTPTDEEIQEAQALIANFNQHQAEGRGAFGLDGIMIDAPVVKSAQSILERARAAGVI
ncbi:MAG TPA: CoA ester lyase [Anaerolineales bacterium]|jgi:citrate lyase subunit beta-like protein|nr:CoA ester lyase [Anaerolineales bacterium]